MAAAAIPALLKEAGFTAGALLDKGNLYGAIEFYEACLAAGVKPLVGADLTCPVTGAETGLIALDRDGYTSLCSVISSVNLDGTKPLLAAVEESPRGIAALCADVGAALRLREVLSEDRVWLEIVANRNMRHVVGKALDLAKANCLRAVASWEVLCEAPAQHGVCLLLKAIADGKTIDQAELDAAEPSLAQCRRLETMFRSRPELLRESLRLAEMADLRLDLGTPHFPRVRPSHEESLSALECLCLSQLPSKYTEREPEARARLREELRVIGALGMADYFLVVADIVAFAARERIPVTGRGSGVGSIVAYLLGITQSDPVSEGLLFERFLNELRPDYPDLDIDVSWKRRDQVIDYVYRRYGTAKVAMISARACFELRLAARETAKAFGLCPYEAQALADRLPYRGSKDAAAAIAKALGNIKPDLGAADRGRLAELAAAIIGFPNHSSVHCGGIVVSDSPLTCYTPLEMAPKGIQVTQFDMHAVEKIGLVKIDLLGNRALSMVEEACADAAAAGKPVPEILPDDPATARILKSGKTLTCFQLESPAMRSLLGMMKASTRADATLALALVRPGPSAGGMKQEFIRRRLEAEPSAPKPDQPGLPGQPSRPARRVAPATADLPVYEEDIMRVIADSAGVGLAEADIIRRCLKDGGGDEALYRKFIFLARTAGRSAAEAEATWQDVKRFARYTFSKAHAASFGALAYAAAYLKAHFPLEFYAAALRNHSGMYPLWVHVNEARRIGVTVALPSVNHSQVDFAIEAGAVRTGLASVKHLSHNTIKSIIRARAEGPFQGLRDFLARVPADKEEVISLLASGALDDLVEERCAAITEYLAMRGRVRPAPNPVLGFADPRTDLPTRAFSPIQKRRMEYTGLGFSPLVHPLEFFEQNGAGSSPGRPRDLAHRPDCVREPPGRPRESHAASVRGLLAALRHYKETRPGLWFLSLDNPSGLRECIVPDDVLAVTLEIGAAYSCTGTLGRRFGVANLRARSLGRLEEKFI